MRTYATINISDLSNVDFAQVVETSVSTVRKNLNNTKFIIKWNIEPSFITNGTITPSQTLTRVEALALVQTDAWNDNNP
tara:strand:+ start:1550 stop:1786 length:237 start_codon:yes stop_codon:yes gene_type:complete